MLINQLESFFESHGSITNCGNNSPILLEGKEYLWYIKAGGADVFSVMKEGDGFVGQRTFLFSAKVGDLLFGIDSENSFSSRAFLAVGNISTQLIKVGFDDFLVFVKSLQNSAPSTKSLASLIDRWILNVTSGVARDTSLYANYELRASNSDFHVNPDLSQNGQDDSSLEKVHIEANKKVRSKKGVLWISTESGSISFLESELLEFDSNILFPITDNAWILTAKAFETKLVSTEICLHNDNFWNYLTFYHQNLIELEDLNIRMTLVDDYVRNLEKIERHKSIDRESLSNIQSILSEQHKEKSDDESGNPDFEAAKVLADYLRIVVKEPDYDKDKEKPNLAQIAQYSKFSIRQLSLQDNWSLKDSSAFITYTKDTKKPAVLLPNALGKYKIFIPSEGVATKLTPDLEARLDSIAYAFYKPFPFKEVTTFELIKFMLLSCKKEFILLFSAGSIGGLLSLFLPIVTGVILDSVVPQSDLTKLFGFGLSLIFATFALVFAQVVRSISYLRLDSKMDYVIQSALWDRLINLPISFFKKFSSGELASKANSLAMLKSILSLTVINTIVYNAFLVFNLFLLFFYDFQLGLFSTLLFTLFFWLVIFLGVKIKRSNYKIIKLENSIVSLVNQLLNSISKIKIAGVENLAFKLWTDKYVVKQKENLKVRKISNLIVILSSIFPLVATIFIYFFFSSDRFSELSVGTLLSFLTAFNVFLLSVMQIVNASVSLFMALPLYDNSKVILTSVPEHSLSKESISQLKGEIELSNVSFRYDLKSEYILSDISMSIRNGEFVALVGASGSGKTTLLRLLLGFEKPEIGSIYYDKIDIESLDKSNLRRQIGTVMQNTRLFPGNIYSNIAGVSNLSVDYVTEICELVGLGQDLKSMPMGLFTVINEGLSTLSGGQRQKILIAKALINKPSVLFLDEATSALDNESQRVLSEYFSRVQATRVIVAHRLSTIKDADKIYVLEKGKIVECGDYNELYARNGVFTELVKRQLLDYSDKKV